MADIGASNWNENDTNNNQPAPDGAPEGMSPSGVNDTIRAVMGAVKRWFNWSSPKVTAGSATAYTLTYGVTPGALVDGMTHIRPRQPSSMSPPSVASSTTPAPVPIGC